MKNQIKLRSMKIFEIGKGFEVFHYILIHCIESNNALDACIRREQFYMNLKMILDYYIMLFLILFDIYVLL